MAWVESSVAIDKSKPIPKLVFNGDTEYFTLSSNYTLDGLITFSNECGETLAWQMPDPVGLTTRKLYEDADLNRVGYEYRYGAGGKYSIWAIFDWNALDKVKLTIEGEAGADMGLKLNFNSNKFLTQSGSRVKGVEMDEGVPFATEIRGIFFDWSDAVGFNVTWEETDHSITFHVAKGMFSIDPTICTFSTEPYGTIGDVPQKQVFYAATRWWVFYVDGVGGKFRSSADGGETWSGATAISSSANRSYKDSTFWDGTYVYYVTATSNNQGGGFWRRGTPASDGSISWETERTLPTTPSGTYKSYHTTCKDSNGYPWIGFGNQSSYYHPSANKATATDGSTWGTGVEVETDPTSNIGIPLIIPLTDGYLMMVYSWGSTPNIYFNLWNGSQWDASPTTVNPAAILLGRFSVANYGDTVFFIYVDTSGHINLRKWVRGTGFSDEETVDSTSIYEAATDNLDCTIDSSGNMYVFWLDAQRYIYLRKRNSDGSYDDRITLVDKGGDVDLYYVATPREVQNGEIMVAYQYGSTNPWTLACIRYREPVTYIIYKNADAKLVLEAHLKARYNMETTTGSLLKDLSGYDNNGTGAGGVSFGGVSGINALATDFDGTDDKVTLGNNASITNIASNALTIIAWVNPDSLPEPLNPILETSDSNTSPYALYITDDGRVAVRLKLSGTQYTKYFGAVGSVATGEWTQVAFTFDGTNWKVYINKVAQTPQSQAGTLDTTTSNVVIGGVTL